VLVPSERKLDSTLGDGCCDFEEGETRNVIPDVARVDAVYRGEESIRAVQVLEPSKIIEERFCRPMTSKRSPTFLGEVSIGEVGTALARGPISGVLDPSNCTHQVCCLVQWYWEMYRRYCREPSDGTGKILMGIKKFSAMALVVYRYGRLEVR
jgi:hypothetical protein